MRLTKAKFDELVLIGAQMANLCFNLGQGYASGNGRQIDAHVQQSMYELDRQWRAKLMEIRDAARTERRPLVEANPRKD